MSDSPEKIPNPPNTVEDKAPKPKGVIPKNMQSLVIMGVAVVMIVIMWLTGGSKRPATAAKASLPAMPAVTAPSSTRVEQLKQAIQKEQQAAREPLTRNNGFEVDGMPVEGVPASSQGGADGPTSGLPSAAEMNMAGGGAPAYGGYGQPGETAPARSADPIKADRKKREYLSLFASNVALTYRKGEAAEKLVGSGAGDTGFAGVAQGSPALSRYSAQYPSQALPQQLQEPASQDLRDAQALAAMGPPPSWQAGSSQTASSSSSNEHAQSQRSDRPPSEERPANPAVAQPGEFNSATGKRYVLFEGTVIETVLMNRLNGSFSGPVECLVTNDVYSHDL
jgi:type IV secretory pathway VirB10-like protein